MADESWRQIEPKEENFYLRVAWARIHRTEFSRKVDAARSLQIEPGTYRTYEEPRGVNGGRVPPLSRIQEIAKKFKVSWAWLATGSGSPDDKDEPTPLMVFSSNLVKELEEVPAEELDNAMRAARGAISAFKRRAS